MKCYFLRHGIAVEPDEWQGNDFDRPLTREGRERMEREAKAIEELDFAIDLIITSPLLRAKQTAQILAERLDMGNKLIEDARLAGGFNNARFAEIVKTHADAKAILLVGHEPTMSATIGRAIGNARVELKKAALAGVDLIDATPGSGTLFCLIPPKVLVALGKR